MSGSAETPQRILSLSRTLSAGTELAVANALIERTEQFYIESEVASLGHSSCMGLRKHHD